MQYITENYRIIHQFPQLNLEEYAFVADDNENNFTLVYIEKDNGAIIQCTDFKSSSVWPLSALKYSEFRDKHNQIISEIRSTSEKSDSNQKPIFCNLGLNSVFFDKQSRRIIIPDFISLQLTKSQYKDLFISNFERELNEYENVNSYSSVHPYLEVNQLMKRIKGKQLNCNDEVPQIIHDLFESLMNAAIDDPVLITIWKNQKKINEICDDGQIDAYTSVKKQYTDLVEGRLLIPICDVNLIVAFVRDFLNPQGEQITRNCMEIKEYHQKNQSGLRLTATKMYELCKNKTIRESSASGPAIDYGNEYEKTALQQYQDTYPKYKLKQTDVLYSLADPYICGKPDSIVYDENDKPIGVVEAKCPFNNKNTDLSTNFTDVPYILVDNQQHYSLNKDHSYHYQIQTYLLITELEWCDLVIYTHKGIRVLRQVVDHDCKKQIIKESQNYFFKQIVPSRQTLQKKTLNDKDVAEILISLYE